MTKRWVREYAAHYHTPTALSATVIMYPLANLVSRSVVLPVVLAGVVVLIFGAMLGNRHYPQTCKRCAHLYAWDAGRVARAPGRAGTGITRGHYVVNFMFPVCVITLWSLGALTRNEGMGARWLALLVSVGIIALVSADVMRHYRRIRWCPPCRMTTMREAQRRFWGTGKTWENAVPKPPRHLIP